MDEELPVTVVVTRKVKPGRSDDYEAFLSEVSKAARAFPGHMGVTVMRPRDSTSREYTLVFRFDTVAHLRAWEESTERATLLTKAAELCEGDAAVQKLSGMEAWFALPGHAVKPPPRHKMALVSWLAAFPLIQMMNALVVPHLGFLPPIGRGLVVSVTMILCMTYVVMPRMTQLFARWLYPS